MRRSLRRPSSKTMGERIENARENKNYSRKYMAETLKISQSMWSQVEKDIRQPSLENFKKICRTLEVSADYLLGFKEEKSIKEDK
ncbi:helix-turn-helix domain-containing protein [Rossellomorea aquimaris]|uniref:helix-turn-helix domain-containing protein n=1 Tax=Rossellomorea aquimaris TaxID=189382 RepID=UPI001CFD40C8|nr:helix-turn-helix transcriptional regulator [Rossellomorea aquimaris]